MALFELCRFKEAREEFTRLLSDDEHGAHAHHELGLILEREGKVSEAEGHFRKATQLSPDDFPPPQLLPEKEFRRELDRALASLPADMRKDLTGVPVTVEDIPRSDDLLDGDPPLSPTILGLFRGPPLGRCVRSGGRADLSLGGPLPEEPRPGGHLARGAGGADPGHVAPRGGSPPG